MVQRVICLYRVSTKKQVDQDDIPMQRECCRQFAEQHDDWVIIEEKYEKGVSGYKTSVGKRDAIVELLNAAEAGSFDILLVYMIDRIGRIADETSVVVNQLSKYGIKVWSAMEGEQQFDSSIDRLLNYIRFWQAEGESIKTSTRTKTRLEQLVKEGRFRGGTAPYGYKLEKQGRVNPRGHEVNEILIDEDEAVVVRRIFDLSANKGYGSRRIATVLKEEGYLNRNGLPFHPSSIQNILKNITYKGILRNGKAFSEPFEHLRIISDEVFERAQLQIESNRTDYELSRLSPRTQEGSALLSGNVYCGTCGGRLICTTTRKSHHTKKNSENVRVPVYRCYNRMRDKNSCSGQTAFRAARIDPIVEAEVRKVLERIRIKPTKEIVETLCSSKSTEIRTRITGLEKKYKSADEEYRRLARHMGSALDGTGPFTAQELKAQMDTFQNECRVYANEIADLKLQLDDEQRNELIIGKQISELKTYAEVYEKSAIEEKRRIVSALIERVDVSKDEVKIKFRVGEDLLRDNKTDRCGKN